MSTLSLRKIKHDSSSVDNIVTNTDGGVGLGGIDPSTLPGFIDHAVKVQNGGGLGIQSTNATDNRWIFFGHGTTSGDVQRAGIVNQGSDQSLALTTAGSRKLIVEADGKVTIPFQPAFNARKNNSQTLNTNGTDVKIEYNNVATNIGNHYSAANDRFTAPIAGMYHFSAFFMFSSFPTDYQYAFIRLLRNGSDAMESEVMLPRPSGGNFASPIVTMDVYLAANDYIEVYSRQSGGSSNIGIRDAFGVFSGYLIG